MTAQFHRLRVQAVEPLTEDAVRIVFAVPEPLREAYQYIAGQHLTIRYRAHGSDKPLRRSYSICEPPPLDGPPTRLSIAVKRHGPGGFGDYAVRKLGPGEELEVLTPVGGFHAQPGELQSGRVHVVAIAAGSGITPVLSILTDALRTNPESTAALLYGNRTSADIMFLDQLAALAHEHGPRFEVLHVLSRENHHRPALLTGRIDRERLPQLLDAIGAGPDDAYYLCGPYGLVSDGREVLAERGASHVRFELFATGGIPAPQEATPETPTPIRHTARITVTFGGRTTVSELRPDDDSVLTAVLRDRPDAPYSCTDGLCGTCRAKLVSGSAQMRRDYALEPDEKSGGFLLTCQSLPTSDEVELDFDA